MNDQSIPLGRISSKDKVNKKMRDVFHVIMTAEYRVTTCLLEILGFMEICRY